MKLNVVQIQEVKDQMGVDPVPQESEAEGVLTQHFGDHTFYIDRDGLHVFEAAETGGEEAATRIFPVRVAAWTDEKREALAPHDPVVGEAGVVIDQDDKKDKSDKGDPGDAAS